jgi:glycosyltransferase involved in cell wall biosynthesis
MHPNGTGRRAPVYVTHQNLRDHGGGASAVTAWVLQSLCQDFDVRLAMPGTAVDFQRVDELYGTSLAQAEIRTCLLRDSPWLRAVPPQKLKSLRLGIAMSDPVLQAREEGLVFNTANEMSFARPAVTYIHCPIRHPRMVAELTAGSERFLRAINNMAFKAVSGFDEGRFRQSVCVANSRWTALAVRRSYGIHATVIYPPVVLPEIAGKPLEQRSRGYVCIGRVSAEKRIHEAIALVDELRSRGHRVHLHIVGSGSGRYARRIEQQAAVRPYVFTHSGISRHELAKLLNDHQFGLHMMRNEHFGMAVAEMASAGMAVIAHRSAGPLEILGHGWPLLFTETTEALTICEQALGSHWLHSDLQERMHEQRIRERFSPATFAASINQVAAEALRRG